MICLNCKLEIPLGLDNFGNCPKCGFNIIVATATDIEHKKQRSMESQKAERERHIIKIKQIIFGLIFLSLIPASVWLWNIHPVLGIFSIIFFCWLAKNKWQTNYYFGE